MQWGCAWVLGCIFWGLAGIASAQTECSTLDLDMNGIPDACPLGSNFIAGTAFGDNITGTNGDDCIYGYGGDDQIKGKNGNDYICGGTGNDDLDGQKGDDTVYGEDGDDTIKGADGDDTLDGGAGNDTISGGKGDDTIHGGDGDDDLDGDDGNDTINGNAGNDTISGGKNDDTIDGGDGDDTIDGEDGNDVIFGSGGNDTLYGGKGDDVMSGGDGDDDLFGEAGDDTLSGGPGQNNIDGGGGTNSCVEEVPGSSERLSNCQSVTYAAIDRFFAQPAGTGLVVQWDTSTEAGTLAFRLLRSTDTPARWTLVDTVFASPQGSPFGASYAVSDAEAPASGALYRLEELTVGGTTLRYGPYWIGPFDDNLSRSSPSKPRRTPNEVALTRHPTPKPAASQRTKKSLTDLFEAMAMTVETSGVVRLTAQEIAATLNQEEAAIVAAIGSRDLSLTTNGRSIPWHTVDGGSAMQFFAPEMDSPFVTGGAFLLRMEQGVTMPTDSLNRVPLRPAHTFVETVRRGDNVFAGTVASPDPRGDFFFWRALVGADESYDTATVTIDTPHPVAAIAVRLGVYTATPIEPLTHGVEVWWNDVLLDEVALAGRTSHTISLPLGDLPIGDDNTVTLRATTAEALSVVYLDTVSVDYARRAEFEGSVATVAAAETGENAIRGLVEADAQMYRVDNLYDPVALGAVEMDEAEDGFGFAFNGSGRFVAVTQSGLLSPTRMQPFHPSDLRSVALDADYLVITANPFMDGARDLASWRADDGYATAVIDVADIFREFSDAKPDPLAIREFLRHATREWSTPPRFVTLVGKGTFDYRDVLGLGGNWVSPPLVATPGGLSASDNMLADLAGDDGIPEIALGRLPVNTPEELETMLAAIRAYESSFELGPVLLASDRSSSGEFAAVIGRNRHRTGVGNTHHLDLNAQALEQAREELAALWDSDLRWVNYIGHGGLDRLSDLGLVVSADVPDLAARSASPIVAAWTCNIARFELPGFRSFAEHLVVEGAATAVIGSTGWSNHHETHQLNDRFFDEAFASETETLGEVFVNAQRGVADAQLIQRQVYLLLGDPGLRIRPKATPPMPTPTPTPTPPPTRIADPSSASGCAIEFTDAPPRLWWGIVLAIVLWRRSGRA